ncbi:MAG: aminotransferase class V-fold PLP-dependent enzyme [Planctomycetota bacterium]|nr:aminotransferase class V-fold PLP-dependent enzyme [Planctomycetota bacterium]
MTGPLELAPEEMRSLGYKAIDAIVEHYQSLRDQPAVKTFSRSETKKLDLDFRKEGRSPDEVLAQVIEEIFDGSARLNHPRFFAFIPSPGNYISVIADLLVSGFNVFAGTWLASSGPSEVELRVLDWFRKLCDFPEETRGLFVSGGSVANMTALAAARFDKLGEDQSRGVIYSSDQTHSSIDRAVRMLGFRRDQLRKIASDSQGRLDLAALELALAEDTKAGRRPFCVVANLGTTNFGAIDALEALGTICRSQDLWLHGDGAFGAGAILSSRKNELFAGVEGLDSLTVDPHKWLFQTIECAFLLVKKGSVLRDCFRIRPDYLKDVERADEERNFCDYGIQLTRRPRALKLWLSLQVFGEDAFREAIDYGFALAERAEQSISSLEPWEIKSGAQLGIVAFRYVEGDLEDEERNQLHLDLVRAINEDGLAMISSTVFLGETVLRLCLINPSTQISDLERTMERLTALARELLEEGKAAKSGD